MRNFETRSTVGSIIVSVQSNKACALHIKRNRFWKPVSFDQKFGRRLHQTTRRKPQRSLSSRFSLSRRERPLLVGKYYTCEFEMRTYARGRSRKKRAKGTSHARYTTRTRIWFAFLLDPNARKSRLRIFFSRDWLTSILKHICFKSPTTELVWNCSYLVKTESPFLVFCVIVSCWTPFLCVSVSSAGMILFTIVPEGKCAAFTCGISGIGVHTTLTSFCRKNARL